MGFGRCYPDQTTHLGGFHLELFGVEVHPGIGVDVIRSAGIYINPTTSQHFPGRGGIHIGNETPILKSSSHIESLQDISIQ